MVTAYYGKNGGKILRRELLPQFFTNSHENVNDVALIRHLATSNIANFMWYNFLLVKKLKFDAPEGNKFA